MVHLSSARAHSLTFSTRTSKFTRRPSLERRDVARGIAVRERPHASKPVLDVGDLSRAPGAGRART